jgi:GTPase
VLLLLLLLLLLQVLGYDEEGRVLNYVGVATPTPADITAAASHMVNFIDMGGHEKYLKTTLYGMTCLLPGEAQTSFLLCTITGNHQTRGFVSCNIA